MKQKGLIVSVIIALGLLWMNGYAGWMKTYGGSKYDRGYSVQQTKDGGYIIAGVFGMNEPRESGDLYLIKTDTAGNELWIKTYGGSKEDRGFAVHQTKDGGYMVIGYTYSFGAGGSDLWIIRTDEEGDTLWTKTYGGEKDDWGSEFQPTEDGGYIITGATGSFSVGKEDVWLLKIDTKGDTLWTKTYGGENDDRGSSVKELKDGGYIVAGETKSFGSVSPFWRLPTMNVWLIRTDASGDTLWTKLIGENVLEERVNSIEELKEGGFFIVGSTWLSDVPSTEYKVYIMKTDTFGNPDWIKNRDIGSGSSVQQTSDGEFIITGWKGTIMPDVWLIKMDKEGDTLWTKTYGGEMEDRGNFVQQTKDGGYIVIGATSSFGAGKDDVWLIKTDSLGNVGIAERPSSIPSPLSLRVSLFQPFKVTYTLPSTSEVRFEVFNATGRRLKSLALGKKEEGEHHELLLLGKLPSGIYFIHLRTEKGTVTQKSVLLK